MQPNATQEQMNNVLEIIESSGCEPDISKGKFHRLIGIIGAEENVDFAYLDSMPGVLYAQPIQKDVKYPLISRRIGRNNIRNDLKIIIGDDTTQQVVLGNGRPLYIIGPCAVENYEQMEAIAKSLFKIREQDDYGQYAIRGGCFKPRTSPHSFKGLEQEGIEILKKIKGKYGFPIITEPRKESHVDALRDVADIFQIGARNMANQDLLEYAGSTGKPVMVKRGPGYDLDTWLRFSEYVVKRRNGSRDRSNRKIMLCERGENPFGNDSKYLRYPSQMQVVSVLKKQTFLPVIFDPSHSVGSREYVLASCLGAISMGYDGLLIEVHPSPEQAITDARQQITPEHFEQIINSLNTAHKNSHLLLKKQRDEYFRKIGLKYLEQ